MIKLSKGFRNFVFGNVNLLMSKERKSGFVFINIYKGRELYSIIIGMIGILFINVGKRKKWKWK